MVLAFEGWLDGLTAAGIVLSATVFGILSLVKSIKLKAKLLTVAALLMFFVGLLWLGPFTDFLLVLFTGENLHPPEVYAILSYMWVAPALIFALYLGGELLWPNGKWILVGIYIGLGIMFEGFLWLDTKNSFAELGVPVGEEGKLLINAAFDRTHFTFILVAVFLITALIFLGIGFLIKAKQSTGLLRRKFVFLSIGFIVFVACGALDSIVEIVPVIGLIRLVMMTFALWLYLGLKT
jgi:hypothetical protein